MIRGVDVRVGRLGMCKERSVPLMMIKTIRGRGRLHQREGDGCK